MQLSNVANSKYTLVGLKNNEVIYKFNVRSNVYLPNDISLDENGDYVTHEVTDNNAVKAVTAVRKRSLTITMRLAVIILVGMSLVFGYMLTQRVIKKRNLETQIITCEQKIAKVTYDNKQMRAEIQEVRDPARIGYLALRMGLRPADSVEPVKVTAEPTRY